MFKFTDRLSLLSVSSFMFMIHIWNKVDGIGSHCGDARANLKQSQHCAIKSQNKIYFEN